MKKHSFPYKNSVISYKQAGTGSKLLFCFHGFGEDGYSFAIFEKLLGKTYTLIALDFPFHGETTWNEALLFTPEDLLNILSRILSPANNLSQHNKFSILAYSMGGRVAFHLLQLIPGKIECAILAAPDGLTMNFWYWLGTQTWMGNGLFNYTMYHPGWFFTLVKMGSKTGLINKSISKFVHHYIDDKNARINLYKRWTTMRKFKPDFKKIATNIDQHKIDLTLVFGVYDRIILSKRSDFLMGYGANIKVKMIQAGHQLLREKYAPEIAAAFSG